MRDDFRPLSVKTRGKRKATPPRKGWANTNNYYKLNPRKDNRDLSATGTKHGSLLVAVARIRKGHLPVTQSRSDQRMPMALAGVESTASFQVSGGGIRRTGGISRTMKGSRRIETLIDRQCSIRGTIGPSDVCGCGKGKAARVKRQPVPRLRHSWRGAPANESWRSQEAVENTQFRRKMEHRSQVSRSGMGPISLNWTPGHG